MTTTVNELIKLVCPLCGKTLADEEYQKALQKLEMQEKEKYEKELESIRTIYNEELKNSEIRIEQNLKQAYNQQLHYQEKQYKEHLLEQRKIYEQFTRQKEEQIELLRKEQLTYKEKYQQELESQFKDEILRLTNTIKEREIQIQRAKDEAELLKKKLTPNQSELTGEVGTINLYDILTEAFKEEKDLFERTKRGTAKGDIIHYIITSTGNLETQIVYDNKLSATVTKEDIEKAQGYKKIHNTNYVIIVSSNLPKREVKNGLIGQKEGIVLVHPSIVVEIVKQIRQAIIKISNSAKSKEEKESKETELYNFITSDNFVGRIEEIHFVQDRLLNLQEREEKNHQTIWKERTKYIAKIMEDINFLTNQIEIITTGNTMFQQ